ncbi:MAG: response regulator [Planctomycetaceae bacterium]|jgi:CheY-like chemotaxis protein|nr:response regulator [Phycisphaerales bacterium]MCE2653000.1 response regulator [Planctomycetaceae bacterium]
MANPGPHSPHGHDDPASPDHAGLAVEFPPLSIVSLDDDPDFRQYIAAVLTSDEGGGHDVRTASTPEEFFSLIESRMPELVLMDMKMGRVSGEEVLSEVRRRWPRLAVIVVTGYPSMDSMRQTFKQDVFDYLAKPFSLDELRKCIRQATASLGLGRRPQDRLRLELGRQIRVARTQLGWTLKDLSDACGISVSQLSSVERGAHLPSVESLVSIAIALRQTPSAWLAAAGL